MQWQSWLNQSRDDRKSKARRSRNKHQIIRQIRVDDRGEALYELQVLKYEARGERDVIRFRNPTEDKRAFRLMLTSADL